MRVLWQCQLVKDMEAGYERDSGAYLLAAIFNERIYSRSELRKVFEEDQIAFSDIEPRYQDNLKLVKQGRQVDSEIKQTDPDTRFQQTIETATETMRLRLAELADELKDTKRLVLIAAIVLAIILIYFKHLFASLTAGKLGSDPIFTRRDGGMWGKSHQLRPMLEACKRAKIKPEISFHVLRHTHGSTLAMRGVPKVVITTIQRLYSMLKGETEFDAGNEEG
jgi:hypothetical protein